MIPNNLFEGHFTVEKGSKDSVLLIEIWDLWISNASFLLAVEHTLHVYGLPTLSDYPSQFLAWCRLENFTSRLLEWNQNLDLTMTSVPKGHLALTYHQELDNLSTSPFTSFLISNVTWLWHWQPATTLFFARFRISLPEKSIFFAN